jgi:aminoglycoside 3-N-acetyltransferase
VTLAADDDRPTSLGRTHAVVGTRLAAGLSAITREAVTGSRIAGDLRTLGVPAGRPLLVHASLSKIGYVQGGARTVINALLKVLGPDGTLVTGAGTPENSTTSRAFQTRIVGYTRERVEQFRATMPAFDPETTPTSVGAVAEALRTTPGAVRSGHPQSSFAAFGREARALMADHRVTCHLGEHSPLAKLYERDAMILLLGVGYQACSAFHLAEYRYCERPPTQDYACVTQSLGARNWIEYRDVVLDDGDFEIIGKTLEGAQKNKYKPVVLAGPVGRAASRLIPMRHVVDFAGEWMNKHRGRRAE